MTDRFTLNRSACIQDRLIIPGEPVKTDRGVLLPGGVLLIYDDTQLDISITPVDQKLEGRTIHTLDLIPKADGAGDVTVNMRFETV